MDFQQMTDNQINWAVNEALYTDPYAGIGKEYCSNWEHAGQVLQHLVQAGHFIAFEGDSVIFDMHHEPCDPDQMRRALMISFLRHHHENRQA